MSRITDLKVKIFADGADYDGIVKMSKNPTIKGFTTNPTLMRKAGVGDYDAFARKVLAAIPDRPVSFEVFARTIAAWGSNVNVKIPVTNTKGQSSAELLRALSSEGVTLNVTAVFTLDQVRAVTDARDPATLAIVSVFAGRIADTGVDPIPHMLVCKQILGSRPKAQLLWASTRELLNLFHAEESGCDIVTVPNEFLSKLDLVGKDWRNIRARRCKPSIGMRRPPPIRSNVGTSLPWRFPYNTDDLRALDDRGIARHCNSHLSLHRNAIPKDWAVISRYGIALRLRSVLKNGCNPPDGQVSGSIWTTSSRARAGQVPGSGVARR
jgi:transaldolase